MAESLDELWAATQVTKKSKAEIRLIEAEKASKQLYLNDIFWRRTRSLALIHEETQTCLGNFAEYVHTQIRDCRKLLREEAPISIEGVEYVSGSWWMASKHKLEPAKLWHERRQVTLALALPELGVKAPKVAVTAHLSNDAIARVELAEKTQFANENETLIEFPAGTNIYELMDISAKIQLKHELGI